MSARRMLDLCDVGMTARTLDALVNSSLAYHLEALNVERNAIGAAGAQVIARAASLGKIERLCVPEVGEQGLAAIMCSEHLSNLYEIFGSHIEIEDEALVAKLRAYGWRYQRLRSRWIPSRVWRRVW